MQKVLQPDRILAGMGVVGLVSALLVGLLLRLEDPMSTFVIPAEDPFTHMHRVREHLAAGDLGPMHADGDLYPPGMHATVAAVWTFAGVDLYPLFRWAPVGLGVLGVLGVGLLLWDQDGPVAALVGAMAVAMAPEIVFRTSMMAPTAVDVALLPFLFLAVARLLEGRLAWVGPAIVLTAFLVFAHPWIMGLLALGGVAFLGAVLVIPRLVGGSMGLDPQGLAASVGLVGGGLAAVVSTCAGFCGHGFTRVLPAGSDLVWVSPLILAAALVPAGLLSVRPGAIDRVLPGDRAPSLPLAGLVSILLVGGLALVTWQALRGGLPPHVDLPRMLGRPLLALGAFGFVFLPFLSDRLAYLAAGLAIVTYPLAVFNPLDSAFWSHRTVVYLGLSLAILGALGTAHAARRCQALLARVTARASFPRRSTLVLLVPLVLVGTGTGATVYAQTPDPYPGGWYRLYEDCEMESLMEAAEPLSREHRPRVIVGDWRPAIVLRALTPADVQVWPSTSFYTNAEEREGVANASLEQGRSLYALEDRYTRDAVEGDQRGMLDAEGELVLSQTCPSARNDVFLHRLAPIGDGG